MTRSVTATAAVALLSLTAVACDGTRLDEPGDLPLLGGLVAPEVLTEVRRLEPPPASVGGNRYLVGWWPHKRPDGLSLTPRRAGARLEIVTLDPRQRTLVLDTAVREGPVDGTLEIAVAGRSLGRFPVEGRVEVPLPADLPSGRLPIDVVTGDTLVSVANAGVVPALPPGEAAVEGSDLVQSGWSLVELTVPAGGARSLVGRLEPPADGTVAQSFAVLMRADLGQETEVFSWPGSGWFGGDPTFEAPIPEDARFVRVRLAARGEGPAARWTGLALRHDDEWRPTSGAEPAPEPPSPPPAPELPRLVVVYVLDALRADFVGHLGGLAGATPVIDGLAAEGTTFRRHFSVAPNTLPSTKTLFTGMVFLTRGGWKLPPDGPMTIAERFRRADRATGLFTGNGNITSAQGLARGFDVAPRSLLFGSYQNQHPAFNDNAERVHHAVLEWLDGLPDGRPAFLHIQTIHPHNPYDPPEPFLSELAGGTASTIDGSTDTLRDVQYQRRPTTEADRRRLRGLYAGGLAYNDRELEHFLGELQRRVPPEEILLIITSDHGEELFDHGGVLHGWTLYDEQLHIPLIFHWPGHVGPGTVTVATDNVDLHATLAALADRAAGGAAEPAAGRSLWPFLAGDPVPDRPVPDRPVPDRPVPDRPVQFAAASSVGGGEFTARTEHYKLIHAPRSGTTWGMGQGLGRSRDVEYLFDLQADPGEQVNLAGEDLPEAHWLRGLLAAWVEVGLRLETGAPLSDLDQETLESLRALGYVD